jgi:hypothetical protein
MDLDNRYRFALAAALVILEFLADSPDAPKHEMLSTIVYSILNAMDRYEEEREGRRVEFSVN